MISEDLGQCRAVKIGQEPLRQIVCNAGLDGAVAIDKVLDGEDDFGYNAVIDEYENMC